ncbi:MAG: TPM domain-containing protein [Ignavibacteria bacterium]|nr:TPM domain-containing protein [Ignavibacteria bacterium]
MVFISPYLFSQSLTKNPIKITDYVTDETGSLNKEQLEELRMSLKAFDDSTSTQICVLLINSLNGETIETVANSIFKFNKIGTKTKNNGVLLLISKGDRKVRIEVGYGLEGVLPDALAKRIIQNEIVPELKKDNYFQGIVNGVNSIIKVTKGEYTQQEKINSNNKKGEDKWWWLNLIPAIVMIVILSFIFYFVLFSRKHSYKNSRYSSSNLESGSYSSNLYDSDYSSSNGGSDGFSGGGGDSGGGGASGDY